MNYLHTPESHAEADDEEVICPECKSCLCEKYDAIHDVRCSDYPWISDLGMDTLKDMGDGGLGSGKWLLGDDAGRF